MNGQIEMFLKPKAPIWHISLTQSWYECPKCKNTEGLCDSKIDRLRNYYSVLAESCPECGQTLTWDDEEIEKVAKKSKDYKECEKLGLHGAVRKNEKGKWEEVVF